MCALKKITKLIIQSECHIISFKERMCKTLRELTYATINTCVS